MIQEMALEHREEIEAMGEVYFTIKRGWEHIPWSAAPYNINFRIGVDTQVIFYCYAQQYEKTLLITNVEESGWLRSQNDPGLSDMYAGLAVKGAKSFGALLHSKRIIFDTKLPFFVDHLLDSGFVMEPTTHHGNTGDSSNDRTYRATCYREKRK